MEHKRIDKVHNLESGEEQYPWMTESGYPILDNGSVEGCDCRDCTERRGHAGMDLALDA